MKMISFIEMCVYESACMHVYVIVYVTNRTTVHKSMQTLMLVYALFMLMFMLILHGCFSVCAGIHMYIITLDSSR